MSTSLQRTACSRGGSTMDLAASDSLSDSGASGGGAGGSAGTGRDALEGIQEVATALGIPPEDVFMDRVRVDRRCLERLILGVDDVLQSAEAFFQNIMESTHTKVVWPAHLKIGSRSRKSPHVVIAGLFDNVVEAKKEVIARLDSPDDRVTMKLDVSYLYHSHMIGRGGLVIKNVMDETGTHIHFPDSNRSSTVDKSSQVSLAGRLPGVEQARQRVRNLMPLVFFFDVPALEVQEPDAASPYVISLQQKYHVQVRFRQRHRLNGVQVQVKGCEWEADQVTEATLLLTRHLCSSAVTAEQVSVYTTLEVSPNHQPLVLGTNCSNIKMIMNHTATQIMVPDRCDPNIPPLKKNIITVTGPIRNVYLARQQLLGSLPILLMFEVSDYAPLDYDKATDIMRELDVHINFRRKEKQKTIAITIKGIERDASNVYEARRQLLGLEGHRVMAEIPATYKIPDAPAVFATNLVGRRGVGAVVDVRGARPDPGRRRLPISPTSPDGPSGQWLSPYDQLTRNISTLWRHKPSPASATIPPAAPASEVANAPCGAQCAAPCGAPCSGLSGSLAGSHSSLLSLASSLSSSAGALRPDSGYAASSSAASSLAPSPSPGSGRVSPASPSSRPAASVVSSAVATVNTKVSTTIDSSPTDSPRASPHETYSPMSAASAALEVSPLCASCVTTPLSATSATSIASVATTTSVTSPVGWSSANGVGDGGDGDVGDRGGDRNERQISPQEPSMLYGSAVGGSLFPDMARCPDRRAPGYEKKTLEVAASASGYRRQMTIAYKAMQEQPVPTQPRVPTPVWSGLGFSRSSPVSSPTATTPTPMNPMNLEAQNLWRSSPAGALAQTLSGYWCPRGQGDGGPGALGQQSTGDMVHLLSDLGLHKYLDVFVREEIDLQAFRSLTERDLLDIGILAIGPRRKMLDAISQLRAGHTPWRLAGRMSEQNADGLGALGGRPRDGSPSQEHW